MTDLLHPQQLHEYQKQCVMHQLTQSDSMLWLGMGLGKTPITLTTIVDRIRAGQVNKTLIFGPLRVIQAVWARESRKWSHTNHLRFSVIHGTKEKRARALFTDADIYLINYENMNWLAEQLDHYYLSQDKPLPFEMVVYDEVSKLKSSTSLRVAGGNRDRKDPRGETYEIKVTGWRKILPHFKYRTGLTGTPASNGYLDLFGQFLAVDGGERLGEYVTHYKDSYFTSDYNGWKYSPTELGKQWIEHKISDITIKMDARDYLDLPDCQITNLMVDLPAKARRAYKEIEKQMFTQLDSGSEVEVFSRASVSNKTLQFCNGSPYLSSESPAYEALHDVKLNALEEVLEEAGGSPVLCSYTFKADAERIMKKFKKYRPVNLTNTPSKDTEKIINKWNRGEIKLLIGHPACLHPDTQVLTERHGWVKIINVKPSDLVFDGVEFVSHDGCHYSGYKDTVELFGITMTPDHKLLIDNEWKEAHLVGNCRDTKRQALYQYKGNDEYLIQMFTVRDNFGNIAPECNETQSTETYPLSTLCTRSVSQFNNRKDGCEQRLFKRKLYMGNNVRSTIKQKNKSSFNIQRFKDTFSRVMSFNWIKQTNVNHEIESRNDSRPSRARCKNVTLRKEYESKKYSKKRSKKTHVYDLVNCGPRHRFLIKNDKGEMFISHNSMGHGVDGLQDSGHILVWFGLNWSLELYEQMCGRINRQGQSHTVSIIKILCNDTVDLAVADAIERKTDDQEGLKAALQRYRDGVTTNELEVNFY